MEEELYDEFGNYIGPDLDEENDSEDEDAGRPNQSDLESQIKQS